MPFSCSWLSAGPNADRSDVAITHVDADQVSASGVSLRGYGHLQNGLPLQDAHAVGLAPESPLLIALVADGSGRYAHSHWLSESLVRTGWRTLAAQLAGSGQMPSDPAGVAAQMRALALDEGRRLCAYLGVDGVENDEAASVLDTDFVADQMSCTLQLVIVNTQTFEYLWIDVAGDGSAYRRDCKGRLHVIQQGSDEVGANRWAPPLPRYCGDPLIQRGRLERGEMFFMVTDGIGEALLDGSTPESVSFSSRLQTRPSVFNIASFVSTVGLHDKDDKTLVLITTGPCPTP